MSKPKSARGLTYSDLDIVFNKAYMWALSQNRKITMNEYMNKTYELEVEYLSDGLREYLRGAKTNEV